MFRRHSGRRHTNILFVIFRLILSLVIFAVLLGGIYSAYKHFSGVDPIKLDPQTILSQIVSGKFPKEISDILSAAKVSEDLTNKIIPKDQQILTPEETKLLFSFLLIADSHNDNANLSKALTQSKEKNPQFIIGLGDYTEVGTINELKEAKSKLDSSGLRYFLTPGDHDLWDCRNKNLSPNCNFREVFGPSYQSFNFNNFRFILVYNSDNYLGIDEEQLNWLKSELETGKPDVNATYVFLHEPLYHPSSDHVMGRVEAKLKSQAKDLIFTFKEKGVVKVFAGDAHYFSEYSEPETGTPMVTVGAVTIDRNPQTPRFAVGYVFEDGTIKVEDVEIK